MTGPGEPTAPAGWYPDPDGAPGMVRWWNGLGWSDVTTPAGPGVAVQSPHSVAPATGTTVAPARPVTWAPAGAPPPGRSKAAWWVGVGVLAVVLVVVLATLVGRGGGGDQGAAPATADPAPPSGNAFPPGTVRIVDQAAGIAYPYLGDGWFEYDMFPVSETTETAGQYFVTQEQVPSGGNFIAQCTSGPLAPEFGYAGPGSLAATLQQVADSARVNYYPAPNQQQIRRDEALTVDGAPAHLVEFQLSWDVEGYEATGERAALLLVDVGRAQPALLFLSIPNTHAELYGVIDQVIASVDVL
ncbi:DUF2510 domain-containing protein [Trujillonella humicola]|uniref:DUF2510 domain-containing protein n=1 Tax=Trujillonella humicola TaxID=3383699 RepID=UPI00390669BB